MSESSTVCSDLQYVLNQNVSVRHGVPGGPDGRPRPCPVGPRRRSGGHYHLLLAPRSSLIVWKGTAPSLLDSRTPEGRGLTEEGHDFQIPHGTKMWDRGTTVHPPYTHTHSQ